MASRTQDRAYWIRWAEQRGRHYYSQRMPYETAPYCAPCVSSESELQAAFIRGWHEAQREETS